MNLYSFQILLLIETGLTNVIFFVVLFFLIIALFYSLIALYRQNKKLNKINKEKTNLIGVVSHDLKSPFNRMFALLNLFKLISTNITEEQEEYLTKMHQVIKDGLSLVGNLMEIRAFEDEGIKLMIDDFDVVTLVKEKLKAHKPLADMKNIELKLSTKIDELIIASDNIYLSRIIENVLSNAMKFSKEKTTIQVIISLDGDNGFKMEIIDQGLGISSDDMPKLFQKFQTLSARPTGGESSTGLGLSIVKNLVEKLEGEILCESEVDVGTNFIIKMPLKHS